MVEQCGLGPSFVCLRLSLIRGAFGVSRVACHISVLSPFVFLKGKFVLLS